MAESETVTTETCEKCRTSYRVSLAFPHRCPSETGLTLTAQLRVMLSSEAYHYCADCHSHCRQTILAVEAAKEAVKARASDAEQLIELRRESLKGICVYCGEVQQYESMEQKSGDEGNRIRVEHIKQCSQRPELKLIRYVEALQRALRLIASETESAASESKSRHRLLFENIGGIAHAALNPSHSHKEKVTG